MARANYGIDAPTVLRNLGIGAVLGLGGGATLRLALPAWRDLSRPLLSMGTGFAVGALILLVSSLYGKIRARDALLEAIPWRGDEHVLDVGCGHGLMLIGAAQRLTTGRAIGIDIWQEVDQAANSADATRRNAEIEGVSDHVEVRDGDARKIPFDNADFDVVLSSLALHNIHGSAQREQALREIARVLKPGGYVGIIDVLHGGSYARYFQKQGFTLLRKSMNLLFLSPSASIVMRKAE
jgi:SAM-dependent methyltransferase